MTNIASLLGIRQLLRESAVIVFLVILAGCSGDDSTGQSANIQVEIGYLSTDNTITDQSHVVMQGRTSWVAAGIFEVTWQNALTGESGTGIGWGQGSGCSFPGICGTPMFHFEVDVPLAIGNNQITVVIHEAIDDTSASTTITVTRNEDITTPTILLTRPNDGETFVDPNQVIDVVFSEEMDSTTLTGDAFKIYYQNGMLLTGTYELISRRTSVESSYLPGISCDDGAIIALGGHYYGIICDVKSGIRFIPDTPLETDTFVLGGVTYYGTGIVHTGVIGTGVRDLAGGNSPTAEYSFRFSTGSSVN